MAGTYSIFISYAHEDEAFKDQLTEHLKVLERRGLIAPWDDRCIDGGGDWRQEIERAIEGCELALLLVSSAFLASEFIDGEELPRLLERREEHGIRVVPLIIRPCSWQFEPRLQRLQALPKGGKAIVRFTKANGKRDEAWAAIVGEIHDWTSQSGAVAASRPAPVAGSGAAGVVERLRQQLAAAAGTLPDEAERQQLLELVPKRLDDYRAMRWAEWSQPSHALDTRFTRLTVVLDRGPQAEGPRWQEQAREYRDLREVLAAVDQPALVLLGPPGCGKSTLLQRLEFDLAVEALAAPAADDRPLAFLLPLNRYRPAAGEAAPPSPLAWLRAQWQRPRHRHLPALDELLAGGRLLLLLDAVNEMPHRDADDYRALVDGWRGFLLELSENWPGTRVVFSCRSLDYSASLSSSGLPVPHVRVQALDDSQVADFLRAYAGRDGERLWARLAGTPQLEAFRSPFYLRLLASYPLADEALAGGRAALLTHVVRAALVREAVERRNPLFAPGPLLEPHDLARIGRGDWCGPFELADHSRLFAALADFAAAMQAGRAAGDRSLVRLRYAEALALIDDGALAEDMLAAGVALQVLQIARDEVWFVHQLLQEYFAARTICDAPRAAWLNGAWRADAVEPPLAQALAALADAEPLPMLPASGWEETHLLAAAMSADAEAYVRALAAVDLPLAGRCAALAEVPVSAPLGDELRRALVARSRAPEADLRARIAAARALGELGDPRFERRRGPGGDYLLPPLVAIGAGRYTIGSDEGLEADEAPAHDVELPAFELGRFAVTNAEYRCFVEAGGYDDEAWWHGEAARGWRQEGGGEGNRGVLRRHRWILRGCPGGIDALLHEQRITLKQATEWKGIAAMGDAEFEALLDDRYPSGRQTLPERWHDPGFNHPAQPVVGVCWYEARAYCAWLAARSGRPCRLPSEAEWEAAAAGGRRRRYPWGEAFDPSRCNVFETHLRATAPVGVFSDGDAPDGLADLAGNVWEWCGSLYRPYPFDPAAAGREDDDGPRVLRGGSWNNSRYSCRAAHHNWNAPAVRSDVVGFRVCFAPPFA